MNDAVNATKASPRRTALWPHQVGGFLGAWLGGKVFEATGNYDWVRYVDAVLAVGAAPVHLPIREARPVRAAVAAA